MIMHINGEWSRSYTKAYDNSIGLGAFGKVWLVKSNTNGKYYAMKEIDLKQSILKCSIINRSYALDEGRKLNYLNLTHSNIITYYESYISSNNETIFWIMDYCDGGTLRDKISIYSKSENSIHENLIWYWSLQILSALKYLHSNHIIHRDLKPDNIYIENKTGSCKIGDFGLSKVLIDSSITDNKTIRFTRLEDEEDDEEYYSSSDLSTDDDDESSNFKKRNHSRHEQTEEAIVYKLINLSQVGTPAYMPPEMRNLIETHLNYSSIESVESAHRVCEAHLYKGDIFSFGCILYEMTVLRAAFENKFSLLISEIQLKNNQKLNHLTNYTNDLKSLINSCMITKPEDRLNINEIFKLDYIQKRLNLDYSIYYKQQVIPNLPINSKFARNNVLECVKVKLDSNYKPISMKTLKYNQNLIIILASKHLNKIRNSSFRTLTSTLNNLSPFASVNTTNTINTQSREDLSQLECDQDSDDYVEETKLIIYDEYGQLYREFNSFLINHFDGSNTNLSLADQTAASTNRELFNFKINDFCIDEENDHMYISTRKYGILRFKILKKNVYFEDLVFNGRLDLSELFNVETNMSKYYPTCMNLIENESAFNDSIKTSNKRRLIFNERLTKRLISIQVDLNNNKHLIKQNTADNNIETFTDKLQTNLIKCNINAGLTLDQRFVRQMVSTDNELICLFDDLNLVNVYDLKSLLLKRTNSKVNSTQLSAKKNLFCLTVDSFKCLYSTDGECIFNLDLDELKPTKKVRPLIKKGENLSHIISWMSLMTNSKLILLSDAVQMENSLLFILNPVCKSNANSSNLNKE